MVDPMCFLGPSKCFYNQSKHFGHKGAIMMSSESESVSCSVTSKSLWPHGLWPARFLCPRHPPGKNTGEGSHSLLHGIFLTQGSNSRLLYWQVDTLPSESLGKPVMSEVMKHYHFPQIHTLSQCCWNNWDNTKRKAPHPGESLCGYDYKATIIMVGAGHSALMNFWM